MTTKNLDLIVLEDGRPKRLTIADISLEHLPDRKYDYYQEIYKRYLRRQEHDIIKLTDTYIDALVNASEFYQQVADLVVEPSQAFNITCLVPVAYATEKAYKKIQPKFPKEKLQDYKINAAAHFDGSEIIVSLSKDRSLSQLKSNIIHELGHYFHKLLKPKQYLTCDQTMMEVIAIFTQQRYDSPLVYRKNTPHHRAAEILGLFRQQQNDCNINVKKHWDFLTSFTKHEVLEAKLKKQINSKHF
ncbi:MAG: hypothetical protein AABX05_00600 [Nanoarchaeota archaeon]|mgnify:CR=1 FL=1